MNENELDALKSKMLKKYPSRYHVMVVDTLDFVNRRRSYWNVDFDLEKFIDQLIQNVSVLDLIKKGKLLG